MIWAALAKWLGLGLAALAGLSGWAWVIRRDAKADARQQTALQAAERDNRTLKEMANAEHFDGADPDIARRWLHERHPDVK